MAPDAASPAPFEYFAFISYSRKDSRVAGESPSQGEGRVIRLVLTTLLYYYSRRRARRGTTGLGSGPSTPNDRSVMNESQKKVGVLSVLLVVIGFFAGATLGGFLFFRLGWLLVGWFGGPPDPNSPHNLVFVLGFIGAMILSIIAGGILGFRATAIIVSRLSGVPVVALLSGRNPVPVRSTSVDYYPNDRIEFDVSLTVGRKSGPGRLALRKKTLTIQAEHLPHEVVVPLEEMNAASTQITSAYVTHRTPEFTLAFSYASKEARTAFLSWCFQSVLFDPKEKLKRFAFGIGTLIMVVFIAQGWMIDRAKMTKSEALGLICADVVGLVLGGAVQVLRNRIMVGVASLYLIAIGLVNLGSAANAKADLAVLLCFGSIIIGLSGLGRIAMATAAWRVPSFDDLLAGHSPVQSHP